MNQDTKTIIAVIVAIFDDSLAICCFAFFMVTLWNFMNQIWEETSLAIYFIKLNYVFVKKIIYVINFIVIRVYSSYLFEQNFI